MKMINRQGAKLGFGCALAAIAMMAFAPTSAMADRDDWRNNNGSIHRDMGNNGWFHRDGDRDRDDRIFFHRDGDRDRDGRIFHRDRDRDRDDRILFHRDRDRDRDRDDRILHRNHGRGSWWWRHHHQNRGLHRGWRNR